MLSGFSSAIRPKSYPVFTESTSCSSVSCAVEIDTEPKTNTNRKKYLKDFLRLLIAPNFKLFTNF
jgi:hypothetical protein